MERVPKEKGGMKKKKREKSSLKKERRRLSSFRFLRGESRSLTLAHTKIERKRAERKKKDMEAEPKLGKGVIIGRVQ